jgi:HEAT repeat protein
VDRIETDAVRSAAALSLGLLCDREATDDLTEQATKLASPTTDDVERRVAESAVVALGALSPPDLPKRLARLTAKDAPSPVRRLALAALSAKGRCGAGSRR